MKKTPISSFLAFARSTAIATMVLVASPASGSAQELRFVVKDLSIARTAQIVERISQQRLPARLHRSKRRIHLMVNGLSLNEVIRLLSRLAEG